MAELMTGDDGISLQSLVAQAQSTSTDPQDKLAAVRGARKILNNVKNPPIDELIQCGFVPVLVECLRSKNHQLQFEAVSAITNIASGTSEQIELLRTSGAVPLLIELLKSSQPPVCEQAVWALGNIIGDGTLWRNYVIGQGVMGPLLALVNTDIPLVFLRSVTWTLSNLLRDKRALLPSDVVLKALPVLVKLVEHEDLAVKMDACWALSFLSEDSKYLNAIIQSGVIPKLVLLLTHKEIKIVLPVLRILGNLSAGLDHQTQAVLDGGILPHLLNLMHHNREGIVRDVVWVLSNIAAGNKHQVQMVVDANLVPAVIDVLARGEFRTQKEAAWAVSNFTLGRNREQISYLISEGAIPAMCNLLDCKDERLVEVLLDGLHSMLKQAGDERKLIKTALEDAGGLYKVEKLQQHPNKDVYRIAFRIIDDYFTPKEDDVCMESDSVSPNLH